MNTYSEHIVLTDKNKVFSIKDFYKYNGRRVVARDD